VLFRSFSQGQYGGRHTDQESMWKRAVFFRFNAKKRKQRDEREKRPLPDRERNDVLACADPLNGDLDEVFGLEVEKACDGKVALEHVTG